MATKLTESIIEDAAIERLSHACLRGADLDDANERAGGSAVVLSGRAKATLRKLNPHLPAATIDAVVATLSRPPHPTLILNNRWFHGLLTDGVSVEYKDAKTGELRGGRVRVGSREAIEERLY